MWYVQLEFSILELLPFLVEPAVNRNQQKNSINITGLGFLDL